MQKLVPALDFRSAIREEMLENSYCLALRKSFSKRSFFALVRSVLYEKQ